MRQVYKLIAALIVLGTFLIACQSGGDKSTEIKADPTQATEIADSTIVPSHHVVAYYFHGTLRCASCKKIEAYTKEAIETGFPKQLKSGLLEWRMINTDLPENEHYVGDYQLFTKSLVIVDMKDGKQVAWKNLDKIWQLLGNEEYFVQYVQHEINGYLTGN
jgi:hypothetical protein